MSTFIHVHPLSHEFRVRGYRSGVLELLNGVIVLLCGNFVLIGTGKQVPSHPYYNDRIGLPLFAVLVALTMFHALVLIWSTFKGYRGGFFRFLFIWNIGLLLAGIVLAILLAVPGVALAGCKYNMGALCRQPAYIIFPALLFLLYLALKCVILYNLVIMNKELGFIYKVRVDDPFEVESVHNQHRSILDPSEPLGGTANGSNHQNLDENARRNSIYHRSMQPQNSTGLWELRGDEVYETAIAKFNAKPKRGIDYIVQNKAILLEFNTPNQILGSGLSNEIGRSIQERIMIAPSSPIPSSPILSSPSSPIPSSPSSPIPSSPMKSGTITHGLLESPVKVRPPSPHLNTPNPRKEGRATPTTPLLRDSQTDLRRSGGFMSQEAAITVSPPCSPKPPSSDPQQPLPSPSTLMNDEQTSSDEEESIEASVALPWPPAEASFKGLQPHEIDEIRGRSDPNTSKNSDSSNKKPSINNGKSSINKNKNKNKSPVGSKSNLNLLSNTALKNLTRLLTDDRISKMKLGGYLGSTDELARQVLTCWTRAMDFTGFAFDSALRLFLESLVLPPETEKIDRLMEAFSRQYHVQNPGVFKNSDAAYVVAFAVLMLHTDAHSPNLKGASKMTKTQFIRNLRGINGGGDLPEDLLSSIYDRIVKEEMMSGVAKRGWLWKHARPGRGGTKEWKRHWFMVSTENILYYFNSPEDKDPRLIVPPGRIRCFRCIQFEASLLCSSGSCQCCCQVRQKTQKWSTRSRYS